MNNAQLDNIEDTDVVMSMWNPLEHNDNFSKTSGNLWHHLELN